MTNPSDPSGSDGAVPPAGTEPETGAEDVNQPTVPDGQEADGPPGLRRGWPGHLGRPWTSTCLRGLVDEP
ncbi:hypothetical protein ACH47Z_20425 [Streptomyces sp. NPDC020192]|uniref:hypothetical protein n=1 Tax=Streptomyces sp. NPDC020192 TaxID=3365066 RepID=UPI0037B47458